jgi:pyruvate dehydrogenase E1 component alpha subunit
LSKIDDKVKNKVKECEKFAEESDYPDTSLMYDAVYEQDDYPFLTHKL